MWVLLSSVYDIGVLFIKNVDDNVDIVLIHPLQIKRIFNSQFIFLTIFEVTGFKWLEFKGYA